MRIECFKLGNFDWISSSGVQINGSKEANFSESAENVNPGDFFKGKNVLPKLWQVELLLNCLGGGGWFSILRPVFFFFVFCQQSLSGAEERRNKCPSEGVVLFCLYVFIQHNPLKLQQITN